MSLAEQVAQAPGTPRDRGAEAWRVFAIACAAVFLVSMDGTLLYAAFETIRQAFPGSSASDLSWVLNAYTVVYAALLVPAGRLADAHGRRKVFLIGMAVFLAGSAACGAAPSVSALVIARIAQAVGAALLTPSSLALVLGAFPPERRAVTVSLWGAVGGLAAALGPSLGAALVDLLGWRWAFFINLPVGVLAWWLGQRRLQEGRGHPVSEPLDVVGIAMLILAVGALAYGVVQIEARGLRSLHVEGAVVAGFALLALFALWAKRVAHPAVDLSLFGDPTYRHVNLATFVFGTAFALMFFGYFFFLMKVWGYSLPRAGLAVAPGPLMVIPVAMVAGRVAARTGHRPLLVAGSALYAVAGLWLHQRAGSQPDYLGTWLPGLLLAGTSVGMVLPSLGGAAVARLTPTRFGVGGAVNQAVRQIGSVFGVALTVALVGHDTPGLADFQTLYLTHMGLAITTGLLCLKVDTRPLPPR